VETHRARLMRKLQVESFADLIRSYITAFGRTGHARSIEKSIAGLAKAAGHDV
jgi:hypothetical protein